VTAPAEVADRPQYFFPAADKSCGPLCPRNKHSGRTLTRIDHDSKRGVAPARANRGQEGSGRAGPHQSRGSRESQHQTQSSQSSRKRPSLSRRWWLLLLPVVEGEEGASLWQSRANEHGGRRRREGVRGRPFLRLPAVQRGRSCHRPSFEQTTVFVSPRWELVLLPWWKGKRSRPPWHSREEPIPKNDTLNLRNHASCLDSLPKGLAHRGGNYEAMTPKKKKPGSKNGPFKITPTTCAALLKEKRESNEDF
jgi:hypothetical protein